MTKPILAPRPEVTPLAALAERHGIPIADIETAFEAEMLRIGACSSEEAQQGLAQVVMGIWDILGQTPASFSDATERAGAERTMQRATEIYVATMANAQRLRD